MNEDISTGNYMYVWEWIQRQRKANRDWEKIRNGLGNSQNNLKSFLDNKIVEDSWPEDITPDVYLEIVKEQKRIEDNQDSGFICYPQNEGNGLVPSPIEGSAWQCYKQTLQDNHFDFETIQTIENSTAKILSHLEIDMINGKTIDEALQNKKINKNKDYHVKVYKHGSKEKLIYNDQSELSVWMCEF